MRINLPDIVGRGYATYWNFKGRYRVCKGSRASKKSKTTALNVVFRTLEYPESNTLVVRKTERTLKDSCYADIKWAIHRLGVDDLFTCKVSPLEIIRKDTGQKILFRGLDDPLKITSITVDVGYLNFCWIEECYEITDEKSFDMLDESIRGQVPIGMFKQITLTLNPWNDRHWVKKRFFDVQDPDILAMTTNYMCNEWLDDADKRVFERMKVQNPRRYQVAGLGEWGIVEGVIFDNWKEEKFDINMIKRKYTQIYGLDYGYTNDPTAVFMGAIDPDKKRLYVFDEIYEYHMSNEKIADVLRKRGIAHMQITADSSEPKSNDRLYELGIRGIRRARKGKDSINNGIDFLQDYEIIIHPQCVNFLKEISNYTWAEDKFGKKLNIPNDEFNHLMDAMRYACEDYMRGPIYSYR